MAVTYHQQPASQSIQASDTPILYVFSGSNYLQPNFCFIVETLINSVVVCTDMIFPEVGGRAHIDISKTTLPMFRPAARMTTDLWEMQNLSSAMIKVSERYGATPVTYASSSSGSCQILKARCDNEMYENGWVAANYPPSVTWLTDVPNGVFLVSRKIGATFSILNSYPNVVIYYSLYDENDNILFSDSEDTGTEATKVNFAVNEDTLADILTTASLTIDQVFMVKMQVNDSDSITIRFVTDNCQVEQQISWLNKLGTYDQMIFTHNRETKRTIETLEYKKQFGNWSGTDFVYDPLIEGDIPYVKTMQPTGSVYTGWISQAYQNWLTQLYESVDVQLSTYDSEEDDIVVEKIVITDKNAEDMQERFEDTINLQVNYKKTNFKSLTL